MNPEFNHTETNEDFLWNSLINGDREAFGEIYARYVKQLFGFGYAMIQDDEFVQDCIQEVFVDLWKYSSQLQKTDNIKLYLFKCLSNRIQKESKKDLKRKLQLERYTATEDFFLESIENQLIYNSQNQSLKKRLANALTLLPIRQKEVINCLFFESFSYEETARIMNINLRSVYTLAWKALSKLREELRISVIFCLIGIF